MQMQAQKKRIEEGEGKVEQLDKNYVEKCLEEWEGRGGEGRGMSLYWIRKSSTRRIKDVRGSGGGMIRKRNKKMI